jgi:ABC-2 family transporter
MIWLTWRQHRAEALGGLLLLAAVAAILLVLGLPMHAAYTHDGVAPCLDQANRDVNGCADVISQFLSRFGGQADYLVPWLNLLPAMIGVFVGAPLLAREFEQGTWRLAWTQAVSRTRWLAVKLVVLVAAIVISAAAFTALFSWYRGPLDQLDGKFSSNAFDFEGLSIVGYSLFAFALGTVAGVLIRRTVAAMAATLAGFLVIRIPVESLLRPGYQGPVTTTVDPLSYRGGPGGGDWLLDSGLVDSSGHRLSDIQERHALDAARGAGGDAATYLHAHGFHWWLTYQPAARYWEFQIIEAAIFIGLAAILLGIAVWQLRRRVS